MANILIVYSTTDGHTPKICARLRQVAEGQSHKVRVVGLSDEPLIDLAPFDKIVIGASIRYGKHQPQVREFIDRNQSTLESKPSAFFSVNVVARKPEKNRPDTNPYMQKFLRQISWKPKNLAVFAGRIDYQQCTFWDRQMIRLIMWITKGPTDPNGVYEFTNWDEVADFGNVISRM